MSFKYISNKPLKIGAPIFDPNTYNCSLYTLIPTSWCPFPGFDAEILGFILQIMNLKYELIPFPDPNVDWGTNLGNGSWLGLIQAVTNGSLDTITATYVLTNERLQAVDYSYPVRISGDAFIFRKQVRSVAGSAMLVFRTFTPAT